ncbi:MAG: single-strand binding protein [Micavibrio sp.]|nr:single-strand binding protein [Micavibrio sp.]
MAGSVNKVILVGNVGVEPEIRSMQSGDRVANISLATSETWKDKSGERQEKTQWHKVVVFNQNIVGVVEKYVKKGAKLYIEGQIETRSWEKDGVKQYTTEIVVKPFNGQLTMLDGRSGGGMGESEQSSYSPAPSRSGSSSSSSSPAAKVDEFEDEIPF